MFNRICITMNRQMLLWLLIIHSIIHVTHTYIYILLHMQKNKLLFEISNLHVTLSLRNAPLALLGPGWHHRCEELSLHWRNYLKGNVWVNSRKHVVSVHFLSTRWQWVRGLGSQIKDKKPSHCRQNRMESLEASIDFLQWPLHTTNNHSINVHVWPKLNITKMYIN